LKLPGDGWNGIESSINSSARAVLFSGAAGACHNAHWLAGVVTN
jgi:hypothetical protein